MVAPYKTKAGARQSGPRPGYISRRPSMAFEMVNSSV